MFKKTYTGWLTAIAVALCAWSGSALATPIPVGGVMLDRSSPIDLTIQSINLRETQISAKGDVLSGYGQVGAINSNTGFCAGCNLTFTFQYTVANDPSTSGGDVVFKDGMFNFYVSPVGDFNPLDPSTANDGTPWVSLAGHTYFNPTYGMSGDLFARVDGSASNPLPGSSGNGFLDVVHGSGPAANWLDTNTQNVLADGTVADFYLNSEFNIFPATSCGGTVTSDPNNLCSYPITGTGTLVGRTNVPEPGSIGVLGLGLGFLALAMSRRRKETRTHE